jgi:glucan 1,4-alpha-glucosidase
MKRILSVALLAAALHMSPAGATASEIHSPDKRILLRTHADNGQVAYSVSFNGKSVIAKSRLGVELSGGSFAGSVSVSGSKTRGHDETWKPVWGQFSKYRDHYNELTLNIAEADAPKRTMRIILRAYNEGIAFRYVFPKQKGLKNANFEQEFSEVSIISKAPVAWYAATSTTLFNNVPFSKLKKACRTPFTVQLAENCFVSLHEAAIVNSSDAKLSLAKDKRTLTYSSSCRQGTGTVSAWRTVLIASRPGGLVESSMIPNLNEPNKLVDTSWIKPGISLWDWRNHGGKADDGFVYGINTASYIRYIDFAHKHGLAYVLIDAEWYGPERSAKSDPTTYEHKVDMPKITSYAKKKGVGIWLYINDRGLKNFDMDRTFAQYQKWGVKGIKHGFLGGGSQTKNAFSVKVLAKCAKYRIMYNLHEPNKPTGLARTYPHYMSNEYVNSMLDAPNRPPATPSELCVFPVVHNLGGPVDRSCGLFDMDQAIARAKVHKQIPSTVVSQAGQCLVFHSGILTLPDMPDAYNRKMDLFEFIKQLPMTYDETKVLEMKIGDYITMARRTGDTWLVAALADESGRKLELALDFLKPGVTYDVTFYEDAAKSSYRYPGGWNKRDAAKKRVPFRPVKTTRELNRTRKATVKKGDAVSARIAPGGGHCMWIRPQGSIRKTSLDKTK